MPKPDQPGSSAANAALDDAGPAAEDGAEERLLIAASSLRELLSKGIVITGDRLHVALDELVERGRMTRQDAEDLVQNLVEIGRRQTQDTLAEIVRRATGRGQPFPIMGYDDLTTAQVKGRLVDLGHAQLRNVRDHERRNANRKSVLSAIDKLLD